LCQYFFYSDTELTLFWISFRFHHERPLTDNFGEPLIPQRMVTLNPAENIENTIANKKGVMIVSSGKLLQFTSSRCTDTQMFAARHARACELQPSKDSIYIRLDAAQRGLGTGSCGKWF
jgi:hypothetical protein